MKISKSNSIKNKTLVVNSGNAYSGVIGNILDPDFSLNFTSDTELLAFTIPAVSNLDYIALHGLNLPVGTQIGIYANDGTNAYSSVYLVEYETKNLVYHFVNGLTGGDVGVQIFGAGLKTVSYVQAGLLADVSWGVNSGQSLHYLGLNERSRVTTNQRGAPLTRVAEETSPKLTLSIKNVTKEWVRTELQEIITHYKTDGILSIIDYEDDNKWNESVAGFELSVFAPKAHSSTKTLMNLTLSMKVSV